MVYIVRFPSFIIVVLIIKMILFFTDARYERPGIDVMNSFGKGIHKYVGLEVNNIITLCEYMCILCSMFICTVQM